MELSFKLVHLTAVVLMVALACTAVMPKKVEIIQRREVRVVPSITTEQQLLWQASRDEFRRRQASQRQPQAGRIPIRARPLKSPRQQAAREATSGRISKANAAVLSVLSTVAARTLASPGGLNMPIDKDESPLESALIAAETLVREIVLRQWTRLPSVQCVPGINETFSCLISDGAAVLMGKWYTKPKDEFHEDVIVLNNGTFKLTLSFSLVRLKGRFERVENGAGVAIAFNWTQRFEQQIDGRNASLELTSRNNQTSIPSGGLLRALKDCILEKFFRKCLFDTLNDNRVKDADAVREAVAKYSPAMIVREIQQSDLEEVD